MSSGTAAQGEAMTLAQVGVAFWGVHARAVLGLCWGTCLGRHLGIENLQFWGSIWHHGLVAGRVEVQSNESHGNFHEWGRSCFGVLVWGILLFWIHICCSRFLQTPMWRELSPTLFTISCSVCSWQEPKQLARAEASKN